MGTRAQLDAELRGLIGNNVYFQPPESFKMEYDCIVYELATGSTLYSDNYPYRFTRQYEVTAISRHPDTPIVEKMMGHFTMIEYNRRFTLDNLIHDVFKLYY